MKYKVFLAIGVTGSSPSTSDAGGMTSFYTKSQAVASCEAWRDMGNKYFAYLWDGTQWTLYVQVP